MRHLKIKVLAIAMAVLIPASPVFAAEDAPVAVAPEVKRGTDWRFLSAVPLLWPIGAAIWASGWQPAVLPADPVPLASGGAAPAVVVEKIDTWSQE